MAKQGGMGDNCYVGAFDLSGSIGSISNLHGGPAPSEVTAINKSGIERIGLLADASGDFSAWFDPAAGASHLTFRALPTADVIFSYFRDQVLGNPAASFVAKQIGYDGTRGQDGSYSHTVNAQANATPLDWGYQLTPGRRTDTGATNGTGVDRGAAFASTAFGLAAYLHVFSFTGTSVTIKIQDSADNAAFADLTGGTFTLVAGATSERIATGLTQTVRRYLRVITTGTFSNVQFAVNAVPFDIAQR